MSKNYEHLTPTIGYILKKHNKYINNKIKDYNITFGLHPILIEIYKKENIIQEDLAEKLYLNESTVTRNLEKLEEKGLIIKEQNTINKRKKYLKCTEKGADIAVNLLNLEDEWEEEFYKNLDNTEFETLKKLLNKCIQQKYI